MVGSLARARFEVRGVGGLSFVGTTCYSMVNAPRYAIVQGCKMRRLGSESSLAARLGEHQDRES